MTDTRLYSELYVTCKYVFYRPEHNARRELHKTEFWRSWNAKWNIAMDRAWRADEKNGVILSSYHGYFSHQKLVKPSHLEKLQIILNINKLMF